MIFSLIFAVDQNTYKSVVAFPCLLSLGSSFLLLLPKTGREESVGQSCIQRSVIQSELHGNRCLGSGQ